MGFNKVFADYFEDLTFEVTKGIDIEDLIDQLEERDSDAIKIDYPSDCSYCDLTVKGSDLRIQITSGSLTIHVRKATSPRQLLLAFFDVQQKLAGSPVSKALAAPAK